MHAWILWLSAFLIPPLPVALKRNVCSADFCISTGLTLLGFIPGILYSIYILIVSSDDALRVERYGTAAYLPVGGAYASPSASPRTRGSLRGTSANGSLNRGSLRSLLNNNQNDDGSQTSGRDASSRNASKGQQPSYSAITVNDT